MKRLLALTLLSLSPLLPAACPGYFPPNDMNIPSTIDSEGLTRAQYDRVIDKMNSYFEPIVTAMGNQLVINRAWHNGTVNASTSRNRAGNRWTINFFGGMARHKYMTEDGFALVYCHEIGHHLGGAPKKIYSGVSHWASTEGQSDYWGTLKCLRRVFENEDNISAIQGLDIPEEVAKKCNLEYQEKNHAALCKRMAMAAYALGKMHADLRNHEKFPAFDTPDPKVVTRTYDAHPLPQCRLDTHFQGALCELNWRTEVSQTEEFTGNCHPRHGHELGARPLCWFKPNL